MIFGHQIFNLGTRCRWVVSFKHRQFQSSPQGKSCQNPMDSRVSRPLGRSRCIDKDKNPCPCRESNSCCSGRKLVTTRVIPPPTEQQNNVYKLIKSLARPLKFLNTYGLFFTTECNQSPLGVFSRLQGNDK